MRLKAFRVERHRLSRLAPGSRRQTTSRRAKDEGLRSFFWLPVPFLRRSASTMISPGENSSSRFALIDSERSARATFGRSGSGRSRSIEESCARLLVQRPNSTIDLIQVDRIRLWAARRRVSEAPSRGERRARRGDVTCAVPAPTRHDADTVAATSRQGAGAKSCIKVKQSISFVQEVGARRRPNTCPASGHESSLRSTESV